MTRDATLDAFGSARDDGDADDADATADPDDAEATAKPDDADATADPIVATTDWTSEGATCEACGATAERRWHQDGSLVCPACKNWNDE
ncbi:MAG: DUF7573 domain-containing protein [Halanaeroarchaeum sp.]